MEITLILLVILLILIALFAFKFQIVRAMSWVLNGSFVLLIAVILSAILLPQIYEQLADSSLRTAGTYSAIVDIDTKVGNVTNLPGNVIDSIGDFFSGGNRTPSQNSSSTNITNEFYPRLVSGLGGIYRLLALIVGFAGLGVIVYLSYTTASLVKVADLKRRVELLEHRLLLSAAH